MEENVQALKAFKDHFKAFKDKRITAKLKPKLTLPPPTKKGLDAILCIWFTDLKNVFYCPSCYTSWYCFVVFKGKIALKISFWFKCSRFLMISRVIDPPTPPHPDLDLQTYNIYCISCNRSPGASIFSMPLPGSLEKLDKGVYMV